DEGEWRGRSLEAAPLALVLGAVKAAISLRGRGLLRRRGGGLADGERLAQVVLADEHDISAAAPADARGRQLALADAQARDRLAGLLCDRRGAALEIFGRRH